MCHVLIIEDEFLVALSIELTLRENGATTVSVAVTEEQAVESARQERPSFITSDVSLAEGLGTDAVCRIFAEHGPVPTVIISGNSVVEQTCVPQCPVFQKPFDPDHLTRAFRTMMAA